MHVQAAVPFAGKGRFVCWNARALFCYDPAQLHKKLDYFCRLAADADVVMVQEAHSNAQKPTILENRLRDSHEFYWNNSPDDETFGGTGFVVSKKFLQRFSSCVHFPIVAARAARLTFDGPEGRLVLCNLHLEPKLTAAEKKQFLSQVRNSLTVEVGIHTIVCGDFNYDSATHDRVDCRTGQFCGAPGPEQQHFEICFADFAELDCHDFTHKNCREDATTSFSRIDRIYTSLHPTICYDLSFSAAVAHSVRAPSFDLSDHAPLIFAMQPAPVPVKTSIPSWVTKHPLWPEELGKTFSDYGPYPVDNHNFKMESIKTAMRAAAANVIAVAQHHRARNADEELWWLIRALRSIKMNKPDVLEKCAQVVSNLGDLLDTAPGDLSRLLHRIAELSRKTASEKLQEVQANACLPEYTKKQKTARLARLIRTWASSHRSVQLHGVQDADGRLIDDPEEVVAEITAHWQPAFCSKNINEDAASNFIEQWARPFPEVDWTLSPEAFAEILKRTSDSGCGPDGVPYSAWKYASPEVQKVLYEWYLAWIGGYHLADDANHALLALIPKQSEPEDAARGLYRHPKNLRPLSLSNTDVKILALALNSVVAPRLPSWARAEQKGFISERLITQNAVDVESQALGAALRSSLGPCPDKLTNPAAIFFDFGAAFPSLAQRFIWLLLVFIGFPDYVVKALQELYRDNLHLWKFKGRVYPLFKVESGVKQGCPFSTALFVIAMDAFIAALASSIGPQGCLRVYADDIAMVLWHLTAQAPAVNHLFTIWALISALRIRHDKCVLVPLWTRDLVRVKTVVMDHLPFWVPFSIALAAKYLGFLIGPDSYQFEWKAATAKFCQRADNLLRVEEGLLATIQLHNFQTLPVLHYLAQLRDLPGGLQDIQDKKVERLTRGPRAWLPLQAAYALDRIIPFPAHFVRVDLMSVAIKVRTAKSQLAWENHLSELRALRTHDDQRLRPLHAEWFERSAVLTLSRAIEDFQRRCPTFSLSDASQINQSKLYSALRDATAQTPLEHIIRERWEARWARVISMSSPLGVAVRRASADMKLYGSALPPFLVIAVLNTWLNGWCTARRFQGRARCVFCGATSDAIEHLAGCPVLRSLFAHHLRTTFNSMHEFLGIGLEQNRFLRHAVGLHAAKSVVETCRLARCLRPASPAARFRAALQETVRKWPRTRQLVHTWTLLRPTAG